MPVMQRETLSPLARHISAKRRRNSMIYTPPGDRLRPLTQAQERNSQGRVLWYRGAPLASKAPSAWCPSSVQEGGMGLKRCWGKNRGAGGGAGGRIGIRRQGLTARQITSWHRFVRSKQSRQLMRKLPLCFEISCAHRVQALIRRRTQGRKPCGRGRAGNMWRRLMGRVPCCPGFQSSPDVRVPAVNPSPGASS